MPRLRPGALTAGPQAVFHRPRAHLANGEPMTSPVRVCIGCTGQDDHPRHSLATPDGATILWHLDCHAIATGCEICTAQLEVVGGVENNPKGDELRAALLTTGPGPDKPGWTAPELAETAED
jgi:hypothetical protein